MMRFFRNSAGFTLVEMIMVISILGILSVLSFSLIADTTTVYDVASREGRIYNELWVSMERVSREVQYATSPPTIPAANTLSFTDTKKAACATCMDQSTNITYSLTDMGSGLKLYRTTAAGSWVLADNITFVPTVTAVGNNYLVTIQMTKTEPGVAGATPLSVSMTTKIMVNPTLNGNLIENIL